MCVVAMQLDFLAHVLPDTGVASWGVCLLQFPVAVDSHL